MDSKLNDLKAQWRCLDCKGPSVDEFEACRKLVIEGNAKSSQMRITNIYKRLVAVSIAWVPLSLLLARGPELPLWLCVLMSAYFAVMAVLNYWVLRLVKKIDFGSMSVVEALGSVCRLQKIRNRLQFWSILLCAPLVLTMLATFGQSSNEMLIGGIAGLVVGALIGLSLDRKVRKHIIMMKQSLDDALCND